MTKRKDSYLLHVKDDCPWCLRAKALLECYGINYQVTMDQCDEWPTWPAIYRIDSVENELIGGYDQLSELIFKEDA